MTLRVQILKNKFSQSLGLPFQELLPEFAIKNQGSCKKAQKSRKLRQQS